MLKKPNYPPPTYVPTIYSRVPHTPNPNNPFVIRVLYVHIATAPAKSSIVACDGEMPWSQSQALSPWTNT